MNRSLEELRTHFNIQLSNYLLKCQENIPERLWLAMKYSLEQKGKRLRPLLIYITGLSFGQKLSNMDCSACAIEFIHVFSLIHDDLPSMDNDDFRRGELTCHKKFDEATAILAGDALLTQISDLIFYDEHLDTSQKLNILHVLLQSSGACGMIGGQILDIQQTHSLSNLSQEMLLKIYDLKTGALFKACVKIGLICANCEDKKIFEYLEKFIYCFGLAFQIKDDLDDLGDLDNLENLNNLNYLGEESNFKLNYANIVGIQNAKNEILILKHKALQILHKLEEYTYKDLTLLKQLWDFFEKFAVGVVCENL